MEVGAKANRKVSGRVEVSAARSSCRQGWGAKRSWNCSKGQAWRRGPTEGSPRPVWRGLPPWGLSELGNCKPDSLPRREGTASAGPPWEGVKLPEQDMDRKCVFPVLLWPLPLLAEPHKEQLAKQKGGAESTPSAVVGLELGGNSHTRPRLPHCPSAGQSSLCSPALLQVTSTLLLTFVSSHTGLVTAKHPGGLRVGEGRRQEAKGTGTEDLSVTPRQRSRQVLGAQGGTRPSRWWRGLPVTLPWLRLLVCVKAGHQDMVTAISSSSLSCARCSWNHRIHPLEGGAEMGPGPSAGTAAGLGGWVFKDPEELQGPVTLSSPSGSERCLGSAQSLPHPWLPQGRLAGGSCGQRATPQQDRWSPLPCRPRLAEALAAGLLSSAPAPDPRSL